MTSSLETYQKFYAQWSEKKVSITLLFLEPALKYKHEWRLRGSGDLMKECCHQFDESGQLQIGCLLQQYSSKHPKIQALEKRWSRAPQ
jgi:hypothetical protein